MPVYFNPINSVYLSKYNKPKISPLRQPLRADTVNFSGKIKVEQAETREIKSAEINYVNPDDIPKIVEIFNQKILELQKNKNLKPNKVQSVINELVPNAPIRVVSMTPYNSQIGSAAFLETKWDKKNKMFKFDLAADFNNMLKKPKHLTNSLAHEFTHFLQSQSKERNDFYIRINSITDKDYKNLTLHHALNKQFMNIEFALIDLKMPKENYASTLLLQCADFIPPENYRSYISSQFKPYNYSNSEKIAYKDLIKFYTISSFDEAQAYLEGYKAGKETDEKELLSENFKNTGLYLPFTKFCLSELKKLPLEKDDKEFIMAYEKRLKQVNKDYKKQTLK